MQSRNFLVSIIFLLLLVSIFTLQSPSSTIQDHSFISIEGTLPPINTGFPNHAPNIILMIGDGMGIDEVTAASLVEYGVLNATIMDLFPYHAVYETTNIYNQITDSAASGTAISTGELTANSRIAMDAGAKVSLKTILEYLKDDLGYATGLVTTTRISHATPAVFAAHDSNRHHEYDIIPKIMKQNIDILLGGGLDGSYWGSESAIRQLGSTYGYDVATNKTELFALQNTTNKLLGVFPNGDYIPFELDRNTSLVPGIQDMTEVALHYLDAKNKPFFVMIEGGRIDHAGHNGASGDPNADAYMVAETIYYEKAVRQAYEYAKTNGNTVVISIADHETGGFTIHNYNATSLGTELPRYGLTRAENNTLRFERAKRLNVTFDATYHTDRPVRFDAYGADFSNVNITRVNDVFWAMNSVFGWFPTSHRITYEKTVSALKVNATVIDKDKSTNQIAIFIDYLNPALNDTITTLHVNMTEATSTFFIEAPIQYYENFTWYVVYMDPTSFNTTSFPYKHTYIVSSSTTPVETTNTTLLNTNTSNLFTIQTSTKETSDSLPVLSGITLLFSLAILVISRKKA